MSEMAALGAATPVSPMVGEADREDKKQITPKEVRRRWDRALRATQSVREQAAINEQFINNKHWLRWNKGVGRLEEMPRNPDRVRATARRSDSCRDACQRCCRCRVAASRLVG